MAQVNACWGIGQLISSGVLRALLNRTDQWGWRIPLAVQASHSIQNGLYMMTHRFVVVLAHSLTRCYLACARIPLVARPSSRLCRRQACPQASDC